MAVSVRKREADTHQKNESSWRGHTAQDGFTLSRVYLSTERRVVSAPWYRPYSSSSKLYHSSSKLHSSSNSSSSSSNNSSSSSY